jgi:hypothetical protein
VEALKLSRWSYEQDCFEGAIERMPHLLCDAAGDWTRIMGVPPMPESRRPPPRSAALVPSEMVPKPSPLDPLSPLDPVRLILLIGEPGRTGDVGLLCRLGCEWVHTSKYTQAIRVHWGATQTKRANRTYFLLVAQQQQQRPKHLKQQGNELWQPLRPRRRQGRYLSRYSRSTSSISSSTWTLGLFIMSLFAASYAWEMMAMS